MEKQAPLGKGVQGHGEETQGSGIRGLLGVSALRSACFLKRIRHMPGNA